jgi:hypothetical protein
MTTFHEAVAVRAMIEGSSLPQEMKDRGVAFLALVSEADFRIHVGTDNTHNNVTSVLASIIEAALLGKKEVRSIGAHHAGATRILSTITA